MKVTDYADNFIKNYENFKSYWNYEDGCVLTGCMRMYEATGNIKYRDFVFDYLFPLIAEDGTILNFDNDKYSIDSFNSGKILFYAYEQTGDDKYRLAIEYLWERLCRYPRTADGNFIHKSIYPGQVWLDGLYMAQPFYAAYEKKFGKGSYDDILKQFRNVRERMFIQEKGLYCHGYDTALVQPWADRKSGLSSSFWLRAIGWYMMALADVIDIIGDASEPCSIVLTDIFTEAVEGIIKYADKDTGLFYQVVDMGDDVRNYTETSGSLMIAYALMKGASVGVLPFSEYSEKGRKILEKVTEEKLTATDNGLSLTDICCSAGLGPGIERDGSAGYYLSEKIVSDDPKGAGVLMMAYAQSLMNQKQSMGRSR